MVLKINDFDWTAKLVASVDCSTSKLNPLVQLKLNSDNPDSSRVFEFTREEVKHKNNTLKFVISAGSIPRKT